MKETKFNNHFVGAMRKKFPDMWGKKIHGNEFQKDIADNLFCINGAFVAIEFKIQRGNEISTTIGQMREIWNIKNAKGIGLFVAFDEDKKKILVRETRIDYKGLLAKKSTNRFYIKIDWDFEFSRYEDAVDLIAVMIDNVIYS